MYHIRPIRNDADHRAALSAIDGLMGAKRGTPESDRLAVLATLVEAYEEKRFPMPSPDPVEAIKFRMEQAGLTREDLQEALGSRSRVSEILNRKRPLTLGMIRALNSRFGIPAEVLITEYEAAE